MKRYYRYLGVASVLICLIFFFKYLIENYNELPTINWGVQTWISLVVVIVIYLFNHLLGSLAWAKLIRSTGEKFSIKDAVLVFSLSQFAKYIPGNVAQHIGKATLAKSYKLKLPNIITSMVMEIVLLVLSGSLLSAIFLPFISEHYFMEVTGLPPIWYFVIILICVIVSPFILFWFINNKRPEFLKRRIGADKILVPRIGVTSLCFLYYTVGFISMGAMTGIIAKVFFNVDGNFYIVLTGIYIISWIAGFLMPGAPAGMGIREIILVTVLSVVFTPGVAVGLTVFLRFISIIGDVIIFIVALAVKAIQAKQRTSEDII